MASNFQSAHQIVPNLGQLGTWKMRERAKERRGGERAWSIIQTISLNPASSWVRVQKKKIKGKLSTSANEDVCFTSIGCSCFLFVFSSSLTFLISGEHMARAVHIILKTTWHTTRITSRTEFKRMRMPNGILMMLTIDFPNNHFSLFSALYILCRQNPPHANRSGVFRTPLRTYVHKI